MKNVLKLILLHLAMFCFATVVDAQPRIAIVDIEGGPPSPNSPTYEKAGCLKNLALTFELTNLDIVGEHVSGFTYNLSEDHGPMHIMVNIDNEITFIPVEELSEGAVENGVTTYMFYKNLDFDLCDFCSRKTNNNPPLNVTARVVLGEVAQNYDACSYTDSDEIFSCDYFTEHTNCAEETCYQYGLIFSNFVFTDICKRMNSGGAESDQSGKDKGFKNSNRENQDIEESVNIYPNPFTNILYLESLTDGSDIHIYDSKGALVQSHNSGTTIVKKIDTSLLSSGVYFINVINNEQSVVKKLVKE